MSSLSNMQCDDGDLVGVTGPLNDLDSALNELGMLATSANSRIDYNQHSKKYLNMLTIDTRYVSNVSIGFRVRPVTPHVRYKPYRISKERHRTRSENNDSEQVTSSTSTVKAIVDDLDVELGEITQLKKAKSLESIIAETKQHVDLHKITLGRPGNEVEVVSNSIQNLRVVE